MRNLKSFSEFLNEGRLYEGKEKSKAEVTTFKEQIRLMDKYPNNPSEWDDEIDAENLETIAKMLGGNVSNVGFSGTEVDTNFTEILHTVALSHPQTYSIDTDYLTYPDPNKDDEFSVEVYQLPNKAKFAIYTLDDGYQEYKYSAMKVSDVKKIEKWIEGNIDIDKYLEDY